MSLFNAILGRGYAEATQRFFGIKSGPGASTVAMEFYPCVDLFTLPEAAALLSDQLAMGAAFSSSAAGEIGQVQLFNPAGSGILLITDWIAPFVNTTGEVLIGLGLAGLATNQNNGVKRDTRQRDAVGTGLSTAGQLRATSNPASSGSGMIGRIALIANTSVVFPFQVVLAPGTGLNLEPTATAIAIRCQFSWRERRLHTEEQIVR